MTEILFFLGSIGTILFQQLMRENIILDQVKNCTLYFSNNKLTNND